MIRALAPNVLIAFLIVLAGMIAYGSFGAPAWTVYVALVVGVVAMIPAIDRWDTEHHPSSRA